MRTYNVNVDTEKPSHSPVGDRTVFVGRFDKITNGVLPQVDIQYQPTSTREGGGGEN